MTEKKLKVCLVTASNINVLGGLELYQKNLISYLREYADITIIHRGSKNRECINNGIRIFEVKTPNIPLIENLFFESKVKSILKENRFDIINSHGLTGLWMKNVKNEYNTKIVHTYHGSTYHFYKNHLKKFSKIKRIFFSPILILPYLIEGSPMKKADKIICVSEHVKEDLIKLHGSRKNIAAIRTGVNLKNFKPRNKREIRKKLDLPLENLYGLYVGRGGFWTKGLDKVIRLCNKIYEINNTFKLIVIGAEKEKVGHLIDDRFVILLPPQSREKINYYYNSADIFFSMSRCDGGAPTMVTSEAMASGCLIVTDKEAKQEVIEDKKNGFIINEDYKKEAMRILKTVKNKREMKEITNNSIEYVKELSMERWADKYIKYLMEK